MVDDTYGSLQQLVLAEDENGCKKLATYSETDSAIGAFGFGDVATWLTAGEGEKTIPADLQNPSVIYALDELRADEAGAGPAEGKIDNQVVLRASFQNNIARKLTGTVRLSRVQPTDVADAYAAKSTMFFRIRYDGGAWQYDLDSDGGIRVLPTFNAIDNVYTFENTRQFDIGFVEYELVWMPANSGLPYVQLNANTRGGQTGTAGVPSPSITVLPAL
jgi:hypothetical protein